ncbi:alpha-1,3/1,6-mannosyltransferase ALG2 isoform X1 [Rhipicephalus microplus]|uniref:alpha-1,3/1,6-mannosyltransferase ALG2 isoform X1 n=1 Tax=Rhipicephalus microplus TaxID=6941 RepID=UPI003F6D7790
MPKRGSSGSRGSSASGAGDSAESKKVCLVHLDLGVGGAERLMVDVGLALRSKGNPVQIITTHHDKNHCFPETLDDHFKVVVVGDWLPRSILGRFYALCSYVRMMVAAMYIVWCSDIQPDIIICDQVSACVPILRMCRDARIVFYCHFPDLMLSKPGGLLKRVYRWPIDALEQWSMKFADAVLVNSHFTGTVFREVFPRLSHVQLRVLYPAASLSAIERPLEGTLEELGIDKPQGALFLSLNRFERKKNLALALHAVELACRETPVHLIMAGGYDPECRENVEHWDELVSLAEHLGVLQRVSFVRSPSEAAKLLLLHACRAVVYTPANEHFGIVPVEAMCMRRAVVACNSGGPTETVLHGETGLLCDPTPEAFAASLVSLAKDRSLTQEMGERGRQRAVELFSWQRFVREVQEVAFGDEEHKDR